MAAPADSAPSLTRRSLPSAQDAWGQWLAEAWTWDWFTTHTFAPIEGQGTHDLVGWSESDRLFREWVTRLDEQVATGPGVYWVRAREPHQFRNATHFHALVGGVGKLSRRDAWADWFGRHGQARIEPVKDVGDVGLYVAKYVMKSGGELVFSDNAGLFAKVRDDNGYDGDRPPTWGQGDG